MRRDVLAMVAAVSGCLLAGPAVAAYALDHEISDQGRYLTAVTPMAEDPAVRRAVAGRVSDAISDRLGGSALPASIREFISSSVTRFVDSEAFRSAWVTLNREAHPQVITMLRDQPGGALRIEGDTVLLDLGVVASEVKSRLVADNVPLADRLPAVTASVPLFSRPAVRRAIPAYGTLAAMRIALPVAVAVLLAAGILISPRRARILLVTGTGLALAMLLLLVYQWITRAQLVASSRTPELAGGYYDALTGQLPVVLWPVFGAAVLTALAGLLIRWRATPEPPGAAVRV